MLKSEYLVTKHNSLNDLRPMSMGLRELRFFTIYLSKINPHDVSTRLVRFSLSDFARLMGLDSRLQPKDLKPSIELLLSRVVHVSKAPHNGGFYSFQLFKGCEVVQESGDWYIKIDAHDQALPLMFDLKNHFFTYRLWNTLRLRSINQFRMYELLKQYEHIGFRIISVSDLREMLGIGKDEYSRYERFKSRVLDPCRDALATHTDISYDYEPYKKGAHGKVLQLKFTIRKNEDFVDQLILDEFIDLESVIASAEAETPVDASAPPDPLEQYDPLIRPLAEATNLEFSNAELLVLDSLIAHRGVPAEQRPAFLQLQLRQMNANDQRKKIKDRFKYLQTLISEVADKPVRSTASSPSEPPPEELERLEKLLAKQSGTYGQLSLEGV